MDWVLQFANMSGHAVKRFRTDNALEFTRTKELAAFFGKYGISHETTIPHEHHQNGHIERANRTLGEMAKALIHESKLPQAFWSYAYRQAAFIFNRLVHEGKEQTPCEAALGFKPSIDMLRVFGCVAYVFDHTHLKQINDYGKKMRHVGSCHDSKGWYFYDESTGKIIKALSAEFVENKFSLEDPTKLNLIEASTLGDFTLGDELDKQDELIAHIMSLSICNPDNPTYDEAVNSDEAEEWKDSMGEEVSDLLRMEVFEEVDLPVPKEKVLGVKWVLVNKRNQAGEFIRKKSRLVAQGFRQIHGVNYKETFAPTPTFAALRAALTMAAKNGWDTVTFDVKTAFLHSDIDEELYIKDPPGYKVTPGKILKLKKSLYGTKQAGRCWWIHLKGALERIGFISNAEDRSTYSYVGDDGQAFLWVHVDDGLLTVSLGELKQRLMAELDKSLTLKWDAGIESIVGIQIDRTPTGFNLHQPALIRKLRDLEPMALPAKTPLVDTGLFSNISHGADSDYLRRIGVLLYIAQGSRPDICFAVHYLARFSLNLDDTHWTALRRLIGYTLATADFKLKIEPDGSKAHPLKTYVDANWGGEGARATHGYISTLWGTPIAWNAKRQTCVARSTCQAEYVALSLAAMESVWLRNLIAPFEKEMTPLILSDNKSAVKIAGDKSSMKRTRHIDREFHFINEQLCKNEASLQWISGSDQLADGFTKALGAVNHTKLSTWLFGKLP